MRYIRVLLLGALTVSVASAATSIATVVSGEGLKVRGTPVPATGVSSWPVASGDELASGASPAVVMFQDQSRLTLDANSRVKLEGRGANTCVFILAGSIKLNVVAGAKMGVCGLGKSLIAQTPFEGQITLQAPNAVKVDALRGTLAEGKSPCSESPFFAAFGGKKAAIVLMTAAGTGGSAAAIAVTRGEDGTRSPSR